MKEEIQKFLRVHLQATDYFYEPIRKGGSDRHFYRVRLPQGATFIFMEYGTDVEENAYWADINRFLTGIGLPVPRIIACDLPKRFLLVEDLGETDLYSLRELPWHERRRHYLTVLSEIFKLHRLKPDEWPVNLKLNQGYDPALYAWEHRYFLENFVEAVCGISLSHDKMRAWEEEMESLIDRLQSVPPCLIHRDFQSQNIMIRNGRPFFLDFQGLRTGNLFYDLASLVCDPYVVFSPEERNELICFYYRISQPDDGPDRFAACFWEGSAQRLMQALGAYGFLGLKKGKQEFLKHIPGGIENLAAAVSRADSLPVLGEVVQNCIKCLSGHRSFSFPERIIS